MADEELNIDIEPLLTNGFAASLIRRGCVKAIAPQHAEQWTYVIPEAVTEGNAADVRLCAERFFGVKVPDTDRRFQARALGAGEITWLIFVKANMGSFFLDSKNER